MAKVTQDQLDSLGIKVEQQFYWNKDKSIRYRVSESYELEYFSIIQVKWVPSHNKIEEVSAADIAVLI